MWFKKKSVLQAEHHYDTEKSADGTTDIRTTTKTYRNRNSSINTSGLPSAADAGNYFYLPALGGYHFGQLYSVGDAGAYWTSSAYPWSGNTAYHLLFLSSDVYVTYYHRSDGIRVGGFE